MHFIFSISWLLFILIFILIQDLPPSFCATNFQYINCGRSYQCSNIYMPYPFWGNDRPQYCGHPRFKLDCTGDVPEITIGTQRYRVHGIYNVSDTFVVGRKDYFNTVCPKSGLVNTTLDFNITSYGPTTTNVTLYYGCPEIQGISNQFTCNINGTQIIGYANFEAGGGGELASRCSYSVIVPVFQSAIEVAAPNLTLLFNGGFSVHWLANNTLCDRCTTSGGQCGSKMGSTEFTCYCPDGNSLSTCGGSKQGPSKIVYILITLGISASVSAIIFLTVRNCRRGGLLGKTMVLWEKTTESDKRVDAFIRNNGFLAQKRYTYSDIKKMTKSFIDVVGQGGFGCVYKGKLFDGRLVAVKVLSESKGDDGEEFINEVASISRTSHVNIVTLVGFCYERNKRALIYEFMHNGSLDKFIYDREVLNTNRRLEWKMLYQIAIGIARGLEYLHRGCTTRILHFDIKPQNILLDEDFCPKISDFGLAKLCQKKDSIVSMLGARGTAGYIAPEVFCRNFGGVSHKSDVYSYGMMVLEMVGGRKNIQVGAVQTSEIYLPHWIYEHIELGEDLKIYGVVTREEEEVAKKMILVSLWCIQTNPTDRPSISKAVEMLEGNLQSLQVPPKPFLFSPGMSCQNSTTASLT